jgi:hypothetical protein
LADEISLQVEYANGVKYTGISDTAATESTKIVEIKYPVLINNTMELTEGDIIKVSFKYANTYTGGSMLL